MITTGGMCSLEGGKEGRKGGRKGRKEKEGLSVGAYNERPWPGKRI